MEDIKMNKIESFEASTAKPPKRRGLTIKTKKLAFAWGMLAYPILQFLVFFVYVNIDSVLMSLTWVQTWRETAIFPTFHFFEKFFRDLFVDKLDQVVFALRNSLLVGLNDIVLVILSVTLAYFFYKKVPGRNTFRIIFFIPSIVSIVIYTMVYKYMFNPTIGPVSKALQWVFGWNESTTPLWFSQKNGIWMIMLYCLWVGTGYNILILGGAIANLPEEVMESARLDGAKMRHELFLLVIPMIWPTISVSILGAVTTMFTLFLQVELLTQGDAPTIAYLINSKIQGSPNSRSEAAAIGLTFTVVATPIILIVKKILDKVSDSFGF
ncbi:MAG: sugar ABC transporter permease [Clostridia bacterium]|nr:sugar ABC transporter permease [Clostridia bacterium]